MPMAKTTSSIRIGVFLEIGSDLVLIKVFMSQNKSILHVRKDDFRFQYKTELSGFEILFDGVTKQLAKEREEAKYMQKKLTYSTFTISGYQEEIRS